MGSGEVAKVGQPVRVRSVGGTWNSQGAGSVVRTLGPELLGPHGQRSLFLLPAGEQWRDVPKG